MPEITVNMAAGRTDEQKAAMMRDISQALVKNIGVDANDAHRLGSLDFFAVIQKGEFLRLISALFLHFNFLYLGFNLFALYVLAPAIINGLGFKNLLMLFYPFPTSPLWMGPVVAWAEGIAMAVFAFGQIALSRKPATA